MRLLLMGPPGAGKGTQAQDISIRHGIPTISTGDIFRANVGANTPLGLEAQAYMNAGEYVPDEITNAMVRDRLQQRDCARGFLLDGYPRTVDQVQELDKMLADLQVTLDGVLVLTVDSVELVQRLLQRAQAEGRADDTESVIQRRQQIYDEQTRPLIAEYDARGILVSVNGAGRIDHVTDRLRTAIGGLQRQRSRVSAGGSHRPDHTAHDLEVSRGRP